MPLNPWFGEGVQSQPNQEERPFRVKRNYRNILRNRKRRIEEGSVRAYEHFC